MDHNELWKILKEMAIPDHLTCLLRNLCEELELDMEQKTGSKSVKEYVKAVHCRAVYLTSVGSGGWGSQRVRDKDRRKEQEILLY